MITLNLIPTSKKKDLKLIRYFIFTKNLVMIFFLMTSLVAMILLFSKLILQNFFTTVVEQNTLTTKYVRIFNTDIKDFNLKLDMVDKIQKDYIGWADFINALAKIVPDGIVLDSININQNAILITGLADNRAGLIEFKENLEASGLFSEVTVPLDNLLTRENISFSLKAKLVLDKIKAL